MTSMAIKVHAPWTVLRPNGAGILNRKEGAWLAVLCLGPMGLRRGIVQKTSNAFSEAGDCVHGWFLPPEHFHRLCPCPTRRAARERVKEWIHSGV